MRLRAFQEGACEREAGARDADLVRHRRQWFSGGPLQRRVHCGSQRFVRRRGRLRPRGFEEGDQMKRFALFTAGLGILIAGMASQPGAAQGQAVKSSGLRLSLIGIAVSDYPKSQAFYERVMGFPVAFKFSSQDGTRTNT